MTLSPMNRDDELGLRFFGTRAELGKAVEILRDNFCPKCGEGLQYHFWTTSEGECLADAEYCDCGYSWNYEED